MFKITVNYDEAGNLVSQTLFDEAEIKEFQRKFKSKYDENELLTNSVIMELIIQRLAKCGYTYDEFKRNEKDYISKSQEITRQIFDIEERKPNSVFRKIYIVCKYIDESMKIIQDKKELFDRDKYVKTLFDELFAIGRTLKSHIDRLYIDYRYLMESGSKIKNIITSIMTISGNENNFDDLITSLTNANKLIYDIAKKLLYFY